MITETLHQKITCKLKLATFLVLLFTLFSCSKEKTSDLSGLLSTVPSSAAGVVGIDIKAIIEDAGCKVDNNQIITGDLAKQLIGKASVTDKKYIDLLITGSTGINLDCAVVFIDSNRTFLTFSLYDVAKFISFIESQTSNTFEEVSSGVKVCGNVAVNGAQGWICLSNGKRIDPEAIVGYASLNESRSFLTTDISKSLITSKSSITGWCVLDVLLQNALSRSQMSMATIASGLLFEDGESVRFSIDFRNGEMELEGMILNDKGKPAKYLLPADKIDQKVIRDLGGNCDALIAFTVTPKLIDKIGKLGSTFGGSLFGDLKETLKNVDGTVAVGLKFSAEGQPIVNGIVTTKGKVSEDLRNLITTGLAPVREDENYLRFSNGDPGGVTTVSELGEMLKGSWLGIASDMNAEYNLFFDGYKIPSSLKSASVRLIPQDGSLELIFNLTSPEKTENILLTLLETL